MWGDWAWGPEAAWWEDAAWHEALVMRLQELLRGSKLGKERWHAMCRRFGAPFDPHLHDTGFLASFFDGLEAEGWHLPPLPVAPSCYGPVWPCKGKGSWAPEPYSKGWCKGKSWKGEGKKGLPWPPEEPQHEVTEKIFVGGLPTNATEDDVREFFEGFGEVTSVELKVFPMTGQHRGFGFVTFTTVGAAEAVLANCEDNVLLGKWIECKAAAPMDSGKGPADSNSGKAAKDSKGRSKAAGKWGQGGPEISEKIFVGALPKSATEDDIAAHFLQFGEVTDVKLKLDTQGVSRCFAFVTFTTVESARAVLENFEGNEMDGKWLDCRPADPDAEKGGAAKGFKGKGKGKVKEDWTEEDITEKVFLGGLPQGTTEPEVRGFCEQYGKTREVALKYNAECVFRGFAFVTFESVGSARELLRHTDAAVIGGKLAEVRPARPSENFHLSKLLKVQEPVDETAPTPITSQVIRVRGLFPEPKQRDVFKMFYNFSITRIRDCGGDDVFVEFTSPAEAEMAYRAKKDATLGGACVRLSSATEEEFAAAAARMPSLLPKSLQDRGSGMVGPRGTDPPDPASALRVYASHAGGWAS